MNFVDSYKAIIAAARRSHGDAYYHDELQKHIAVLTTYLFPEDPNAEKKEKSE